MAKKVRSFVLLGGVFGPDGAVLSAPMISLSRKLHSIPGVTSSWHPWHQWEEVAAQIRAVPADEAISVTGYSGGGTRAIWVAHDIRPMFIELMILFDPSPKWQMMPVPNNVKECICYWNKHPFMWPFGGGKATGDNVRVEPISMQHAYVQASPRLHEAAINEVRELLV